MPATATVVLTALPNGIVRASGRQYLALSVLVSPRLERTEPARPDEGKVPLGDYPDLAEWPSVVAEMRWTAHIAPRGAGTGANVPAQPAAPQVLDPALWRSLFPADSRVPRYRFEHELSTLPVVSYPAGEVADHIRLLYGTVGGRWPRDLPPIIGPSRRTGGLLLDPELLGPVAGIATLNRVAITTPPPEEPPPPPQPQPPHIASAPLPPPPAAAPLKARELVALGRSETDRQGRARRIAEVRSAEGPTATNYLLLRAFHHRDPASVPDVPPPDLDFHQKVSLLGNYPSLMRRCGLVVDLLVPLSDPLPAAPMLVSVTAQWGHRGAAVPRSPRTLTGPDFRPVASPGADIAQGYLKLETAAPGAERRFQLCQLDVDGAGLKLLSLVETLWSKLRALDLRDRPDNESLPALRSAGLGVLRLGRGGELEKSIDRSMTLQNTPGALDELKAEDVTRGYRVDVLDETTGQWRSLHQQRGHHRIAGRRIEQPTEEGFVEPGTTRPLIPPGAPPGSPADALQVHERTFSWEGWSLSVPPVGKAIEEGDGSRTAPPGPPPPAGSPANPLPEPTFVESRLEVEPHTLPRLRFGRSYRLRARAVDLAGNGIQLADAGEEHATPPERYLRLEPVLAPFIIPVLHADNSYSPAESLQRLAIRSDRAGQPLGQPGRPRPTRLLVPPPAGQRTVEMHGVFDDELDRALDASREGRGQEAEQRLARLHRFIVEHDNDLPRFVRPSAAAQPQAGLPAHLPDPLAFGVALRTLPGETPWVQSFYSSGERSSARWEEPLPIRVSLDAARPNEPASAEWVRARRELVIRLRPSQVLRLDCSSTLCPEALELFQVWQWMKDLSPEIEEARLDAIHGDFWLLTPKQEIVLVHAVKQPLLPPLLENVDGETATRDRGQTALVFNDRVCGPPVLTVHQASTSKVDVMAEYREPIDDPTVPDGTRWLEGKSRAFDVIVQPPPETGIAGEVGVPRTAIELAERAAGKPKYRHELGDTKYRRVRYRGVATTRFREYFEPVRAAQPAGAPPSPVEREFTIAGDPVTLDVLATARPAGAQIVSIVPTFAWHRSRDVSAPAGDAAGRPPEPSRAVREHLGFSAVAGPDAVSWSERRGKGLRIYLDRPWWSSGEGELLGVVLVPRGRELEVAKYLPYVTTWGVDPTTKNTGYSTGALPEGLPGLQHFPRAVGCHEGARLGELVEREKLVDRVEPLPVAVAGHAVAFDQARCLWYCDLEIDVGAAYFPFIRLALARFQPHSVEGVHLSAVSVADFIQVAPDRILTVSSRDLSPSSPAQGSGADRPCDTSWARKELLVTLAGPSPERGPNEIRIEVQQQRTLAEGDFGWVTRSAPDVEVREEAPLPGTLHRAVVRLPTRPDDPANPRYRLLVKEYERHVEDGDHSANPAPAVPTPGQRREPGLRLMYAEIVDLFRQ